MLEERKLSQADAAKVLGVTQPKVSALRHYKLAGFSVERLMNLLTALDQDVEIVIRESPARGRLGGLASSRPRIFLRDARARFHYRVANFFLRLHRYAAAAQLMRRRR